MLFIPEIRLYRLITSLLDFVRDDLNENKTNLNSSYLYELFGDEAYDKYELFKQGRLLLDKQNSSKRYLEICIGYNVQRSASPTIHIIIPGEEKGLTDSIGFNPRQEGYLVEDNDSGREAKGRSFQANYNLLVTSENMGDVLLISHLLQGLVIGGIDQFSLGGFENLSLNMQDITLQQDIVPTSINHRIIGLRFSYETEASSITKLIKVGGIKISGKDISGRNKLFL